MHPPTQPHRTHSASLALAWHARQGSPRLPLKPPPQPGAPLAAAAAAAADDDGVGGSASGAAAGGGRPGW